MKSAQTVAVLILVTTLINGLNLDAPITCVLPFMGGMSPNIYDVVGVAVIVTMLWGLWRLSSNRHDQE